MHLSNQIINGKSWIAHISGLSLLIFFIVVLKIDTYHIRWWDESIYAVNTYEMLKNGNYFSLYFDGSPDFFNSKPPLLIWLQLFFVKLIGYNELAVRLPSVIAASLSIILVFVFIAKRFNFVFAWISALVLLTSSGFIGFHTARTGDSDALVTFFILAAALSFISFVYDGKDRSILFFFLFTSLAFLTKMYVAVFLAPAYLIILLRHKKVKAFIVNRFFLAGFCFFVIVCGSILYLRELETAGYLDVVLFKEGGRFFNVVESHKDRWEFYLDNFFQSRFAPWFIPLIIGILFSNLKQKESDNILIRDLIWIILSFFAIITLSATKLFWYDAPLYPFLSMVAAYGIYRVFAWQFLSPEAGIQKKLLVLILIFAYPYYMNFRSSQTNRIPDGEQILEAKERFIFNKIHSNENLSGLKVYYSHWPGSLLFYKYKLAEKKQNIALTSEARFQPGDRVLVSQDSLFNILELNYKINLIEEDEEVRLVQIE